MVYLVSGIVKSYAWGSGTAIQRFTGGGREGSPLAEMWYGAHPAAPSVCPAIGVGLGECLARFPDLAIGADFTARFGKCLPYLLKLIAPAAPLSIQVHPTKARAEQGYAAEEAAGIPADSPKRSYRDQNHKPELVYALTEFNAMCGFRAPRRAVELLKDLDSVLARRLVADIQSSHPDEGMRAAFTALFRTPPTAGEVDELVNACARRLESGERQLRVDRTVVEIAGFFQGDPGVIAPLLLNPVTLRPGEALFVPAGAVHGYISGLAVELMAASDNVLRAGLTPKHINVEEMLSIVNYTAAPPLRIAPEVSGDGAVEVFYVPVDDFELSVIRPGGQTRTLRRRGPRIVLGIEGTVTVNVPEPSECAPYDPGISRVELGPGQAVFVADCEGPVSFSGDGRAVMAAVP